MQVTAADEIEANQNLVAPTVVAAIVVLIWVLVAGLCGYQTAAARMYEPKIARYTARKMDFLQTATKALVVENHPFSWQAGRYRAEVIGCPPTRAELQRFLAQATFLQKYSAQADAHILLLNTPAILPGLLFAALGAIGVLRGRRWWRAQFVRRCSIGAALLSLTGVTAALALRLVPAGFSLGPLHRVVVAVNLLEVIAWLLVAGLLTRLILRVEHSFGIQACTRRVQGIPWWMRRLPVLAVAGAAGLGGLLAWGAGARVKSYHALAGTRLAALRELQTYKKEGEAAGAPDRATGYLRSIFELNMLFFSKGDLLRSIAEIRAETQELKLKHLNARFTRELRAVALRLESLGSDLARLGFALPYRGEFDALVRREDEMRRCGVASLDEERVAFAGIGKLAADAAAMAIRLAADREAFAALLTDLQRASDFDRQARLILRNYTDKPLEAAVFTQIEQEAIRMGPPFAGRQSRVHEELARLRVEVQGLAQNQMEGYLHQRSLSRARQLLSDVTNRLAFGLPAQQRELERLETEAQINANIAGLQGRWQMTESDSGMTKNYAITRTISISPGSQPTTVRLNVTYSNTYKDGLLAKKKTIQQEWAGQQAIVDVRGARLTLPDYRFVYDERKRGETSHAQCLLQLGAENRTLEVVVNGRVIYRLQRL